MLFVAYYDIQFTFREVFMEMKAKFWIENKDGRCNYFKLFLESVKEGKEGSLTSWGGFFYLSVSGSV
jgi:hypothetical protein